MLNQTASYDNQFYEDNVYGHALKLLQRHRTAPAAVTVDGIHLDIGCGYARIAEPLTKALGVSYVGIDADHRALAAVADRGLESHFLELESSENLFDQLSTIVAGRSIVSITMLDTLEHLASGGRVLAALSRLAHEHRAFFVISVPNVTHRDIGFKLAFGKFDYTADGLLDHTHLRLFSEPALTRMLVGAGFYKIDQFDVRLSESDQHFPDTHPALGRSTALNQLMSNLREQVDQNGDVNQFIWLCLAGPRKDGVEFFQQTASHRPFLSIVTRTQGRRIQSLVEVLTCLAGQSCIDFELIVVGHRVQGVNQLAIERVLDDSPQWLKEQTRFLKVDKGNRTHPLNCGFEASIGEYIAILDDDDTPMAHWVETFKTLALRNPGRLLRTAVVRQDVINVRVQDRNGVRAVGPLQSPYPAHFDFIDHLRGNMTPPISVAFPRGVFHDLKIKFDEDLTTTEDWDYIMRVAAISDTASSNKITSIYHWWPSDDSSRTEHSSHEWVVNHQRILQKMDEEIMLFPKGTTFRIRTLLDEVDRLKSSVLHTEARCETSPEIATLKDQLREQTLRHAVTETIRSNSWRLTSPLRFFGWLAGRRPITVAKCQAMSANELEIALHGLHASRSWRATKMIRRLKA